VNPPDAGAPAGPPAGWRRLLFPERWPPAFHGAIALTLATFLAYAGALDAPFIGDERVAIRSPAGTGWPVTDLSLALNHALGGPGVRGYHATNLGIHLAAGLFLFGILGRTLARGRGDAGDRGTVLMAAAGALLWLLHPALTAAVVPIGQRGPLLGGLFLFLALYAFVRATEAGAARGWRWLSPPVVATGMAANEVMIAAPILILLHDRTFIAGSLRAAWQQRGWLHLGLAAPWILPIALLARGRPGAGGGGFWSGIGPAELLAEHGRAAILYLKLALWPHPLVFDYGIPEVSAGVWPLAALALLGLGAGWALWRRPVSGYLGVWFLAALAAGSCLASPATGVVSEHRMYVPLAAVAAAMMVAALRLPRRLGLLALAMVAAGLGLATRQRSAVYGSALSLWSDTVTRAPSNARAHHQLGNALAAAGRLDDAVARYEAARGLAPGEAAIPIDLAGVLLQLGRVGEAAEEYRAALQRAPQSAGARVGLAAAMVRLGRMEEAAVHYEEATRLGVNAAEGRRLFGRALAEVGRIDEALVYLEEAVELEPADAGARVVLGMVLSAAGRPAEGLRHLLEAVQVQPEDPGAHYALGDALLDEHRPAEALLHYETALRLQPGRAAALHASMGDALGRLGRAEDAIRSYETALRLNPDQAQVRESLARIRAAAERHGGRRQ
jgi:tetratricopeptide (TPR) repeat protein